MYAFVALLWDPECGASASYARSLHTAIRNLPGSGPVLRPVDGLLVCDLGSNIRNTLTLIPQTTVSGGVLFGTAFSNKDAGRTGQPVSSISGNEAIRLCQSRGASVTEDFWGSYIVFLSGSGRRDVVTDPTSAIPCFYLRRSGVTIILSHLEKCPFLPQSAFSLNYDFISALIAYDKIQNGQTGLTEIRELTGGRRLTIAGGHLSEEMIWDPRSVASRPLRLADTEAAETLRDTTRYVVRARANAFDRVKVHLSGGLDSSIVLSCLAGHVARSGLSAAHDIVGKEEQSEAHYARAAAEFCGADLRIRQFEASLSFPAPETHPLSVRPYRQFLTPDLSDPAEKFAEGETGSAVFSGQGGDHLFLADRTAAGFADYIRLRGLSADWPRMLLNSARLSDRSVWHVLVASLPARFSNDTARGILKGIQKSRTPLSTRAHDRLNPADCAPEWAVDPAGLPPGKFDQVSRLAHMYHIRETLDRPFLRQMVHPLISQPLIELCLRLPVYQLSLHGVSRGLVREAFRGLIPDSIRTRTAKGETTRYFMEQIRRNRAFLADYLAGGSLAEARILDPDIVNRWIRAEAVDEHSQGRRLLVCYTIESWLRRWDRCRQADRVPAP